MKGITLEFWGSKSIKNSGENEGNNARILGQQIDSNFGENKGNNAGKGKSIFNY